VGPAVRIWLCVGLLGAVGCGPGAKPRPNIILFTLDTLRADRLNAKTAPFIESVAAEGVLFERCFAPRGQTHPSLASMLTGLYPATHGLRENGQPLPIEHVPLPVYLQQEGYRTAGFCSNLDIAHWSFWVRGFDLAEDGIEGALQEEGYGEAFRYQKIWDDRVVEKAIRWIETLPIDAGDAGESVAPIFLWVHLYDVHAPYVPLPEFAARFEDPEYEGPARHPAGRPGEPPHDRINPLLDRVTLGREPFGEADLRQVRALYDASVLECDQKLERVAGALKARGLWDDALVIVSSDHGEELGDHHRYFFHGNSIYDSVLRIPLILARPGRGAGGRRTSAPAQNLDLFATALDAAGAELPEENEGFSLLPILDGTATSSGRTYVFAEWQDLIFSVSDGAFKYIHNPGGVQPRKRPYHLLPDAAFPYECFELHDLAADPLEQVNLYREDHPRLKALRLALSDFLGVPRHRARRRAAAPDPNPLAALGYLGHVAGRDVLTIDCGR